MRSRRRRRGKNLQSLHGDVLSNGILVIVGHDCNLTIRLHLYCSKPKAGPFKKRQDQPGSEQGKNKRRRRRVNCADEGGMPRFKGFRGTPVSNSPLSPVSSLQIQRCPPPSFRSLRTGTRDRQSCPPTSFGPSQAAVVSLRASSPRASPCSF